ncbi:hypothetical protein HFO58_11020 [Rhizobium leguminosarum]|uniref:hypothetical protein n=1 Tax=Rhizobium leguminosarum TaxID=384 RepID=UPI001C980142|nr:hypothetical protein [Rhizobium leguminosarum]MBY5533688.1 hypothetical protein [Rhizobium leguminosarum]
MVTPLQSVRLLSSQFLLKAIKETEQQSQSQSSGTRNALLQRYGIDTSSDATRSQKTLSALLEAISSKANAAPTLAKTVSTDVTSASFMEGLKEKLEEMTDVQSTSSQAKAMLAALGAGTLTVTDPVKGVTVKAWDVDSAKEKSTSGKSGDKVEATDWSSFLKSHLARGDTGAYTKTAQGSYIDIPSGGSAYFGIIGADYVYLTWPHEKTAA